MQDIKLIVNGEELELSGETSIPITLQAQNIGDITEKVGSFSRSFTIKATAKNRRILDNSYTFQNDSTFPYRRAEAILVVNGIQLAVGNVIVENDGMGLNEIRLTFYTGNSTFYQLVSGLQLRQLCYKNAQHFYWTFLVQQSRFQTEDYIYPVMIWRDDTQLINILGANEVSCAALLPALKLSYVMNQIASFAGYTIDLTDSVQVAFLYNRIAFPMSGSKFLRDKYYSNRNNWLAKWTTTQAWNLTGTVDITDPNCPWQQIRIGEPDGNGYAKNFDTTTCARFSIVNPDDYFFGTPDKIRVRYTIEFALELATNRDVFLSFQDDTNVIKLDWLYNATSEAYDPISQLNYIGLESNLVDGVWSIGGNQVIQATQDRYYFKLVTEADMLPAQNIQLVIYSETSFAIEDVKIRSEFIQDNGTTDDDRKVVRDEYFYDSNWIKCIVSPSMCLPEISVSLFLKSIAQMFGFIYFIDESNKLIKIRTVQDILFKLGSAKDWTEKVVNNELSFWNTRPNSFAQLNKFRYTNESPLEDEFMSYEMTIDDETLEDEKNVVQLPFSASEDKYRWNARKMAYVPRMDALLEVNVSGQTKQRIIILETGGAPVEYKFSDGAQNLSVIENNNLNIVWGTFAAYQINLSWNVLQSLYYKDIFPYVKRYRELTVYAILNAVDVQSLDFENPVYLKQYNAYFYIQKIQDWLPNKPCKIQLLKLQ